MSDNRLETEDVNYLANFWVPTPGDRLELRDGQQVQVERLEPGYEEQAICTDGQLVFVQDAHWLPEVKDVIRVVESQGGRVMGNYVRYKTMLFPLPTEMEPAIRVLRTIRQMEMQK